MDKTKNITRRDPKYYKTIPLRGITLDFSSVGLVFLWAGRGGMAKTRPFDRLRDLHPVVQTGNAYPSLGRAR